MQICAQNLHLQNSFFLAVRRIYMCVFVCVCDPGPQDQS